MVNGIWVEQYAHVSRTSWSTRFNTTGPCGPMLGSCLIDVDPGNDSSWLMLGKEAGIYADGIKVFGGKVSGLSRTVPREVEFKSWSRLVGGESDSGPAFGRTVDNVSYTPTADTTPSWLLDASLLEVGVADDRLYTRVVATYVVSVDGSGNETTGTVTVNDAAGQFLYDVITYDMDLTGLGVISSGTATTYATNQLAEFTIPEWLSRAQVSSMDLLTLGGLPAHLPSVKAGQVVQLFNVPNTFGGIRQEMSLTVVLGEVEHQADEPDRITIAPTRLAVLNIADALVAAKRAAEEALQAAGA